MPNFEQAEKDRQAHFRETSPTISAEGRMSSDISRPWLLALNYEDENLYPTIRGQDGAHRFFEERRIKWWRHGPSGDVRQVNRPTRNMASSQIACVNFLIPLVRIDRALAAVIRAVDSDVKEIVPIEQKGNASLVELEWIGEERPLEPVRRWTRGVRVTSVDAFMVAATSAGLRAYLMEWKYTERYRMGHNLGKGNPETRQRWYSHLYNDESSSFNRTVSMDELLYEPFYQLMRLRLLADRMVKKGELGVSEAKVVVVVPEGNDAYRNRVTSPPLEKRFQDHKTVSDVFRATLKQPNAAYKVVCPSRLAAAVEQGCGDAAAEWVSYQRERYGL